MPLTDAALRTILRLELVAAELPERELVQEGIDLAQAATSSRIGYLHYLNEDQDTIELGAWSRDTRGYCTAVYDRHYPISTAGIWADSARARAPCVHNDYASTPENRGLPQGHSALLRHLGVPVIDRGKVRLLIGVGNKDVDYDADDVAALTLVGQRIWSLVRQRRLAENLLDVERRLRRTQEIAAVTGWEYDIDDDRLRFDAMFSSIFRTHAASEAPVTLDQLLRYVVPTDHRRLRQALTANDASARRMLKLGCRRVDGATFAAELKIDFRPREIGRGLIALGILQDISEQLEVEDLRRRADADALTGLPNRNRLHSLFSQGDTGRRDEQVHFAFLYIDLDAFKPVNDTHGHTVGDEVLRIVASRIRHTVRKNDVVARIGGDEFAIVQRGLQTVDTAGALADKIIASVSEPITILGQIVRIGASIGIAFRTSQSDGFSEVSSAADRALYRAKATGGGRWVVAFKEDLHTP
jgi:diguanylate cyclase (GGDEF)-like protein